MPPRFDQLAERLRRNREQAIRYAKAASGKRLVELLNKANAELDQRLRQTAGLSGPGAGREAFSHAQARIAKEQIKRVLVPLRRGITTLIVEQSQVTASSAVKGSLAYMREAERFFTGIGAASAPRLHEAMILDTVVSGMESSVLRRLATSGEPQSSMKAPHPGKRGILDRYGTNVIGKFEEQLKLRFVAGKPWNETREAIIRESPFLTGMNAGSGTMWAERIVRTEVMAANNRANWETIGETNKVLGDAVKILAATFDDRTAADSYAVHGQIRRVDEPFESWFGAYMHPPNRPNDREIVVPHRLSWPIPDTLRWRSDGEIAAAWGREGRKSAMPPRPKMTTIPLEEFGKVQPLPKPQEPPETTPEATKAPEAKPKPEKPVKAPPSASKEPPSVMVDGEKLPVLGKGVKWGSNAPLDLEEIRAPRPKGVAKSAPWSEAMAGGGLDLMLTPEANRAKRTLRTISGVKKDDIPSKSLGFVPLEGGVARTMFALGQDLRESLGIEWTSGVREVFEGKRTVAGAAKSSVRIDQLKLAHRIDGESNVSLTSVRGKIERTGSGMTYTDPVVVVRKGGEMFVIMGADEVAAQRLLGRFKVDAIVIDYEATALAKERAKAAKVVMGLTELPKATRVALGHRLEVQDRDTPLVRERLQDIGQIPTIVFERLAETNWAGIRLGNKGMGKLFPWLSGKQPRGWEAGSTWDEVAGVYSGSRRMVGIGAGRGAGAGSKRGVAAHEVGHAIGDRLGFDDHATTRKAHRRLYKAGKLTSYEKQEGPGGQAGRQEFFAETIGWISTRGYAVAVARYDSEWIDFVVREVFGGKGNVKP